MNTIVYVNAVLLMGMGALMAVVAVLFADTREIFGTAAVLTLLIGGMIALSVSHQALGLRRLHVFLLTSSIWITGATAGALPLWLWQMTPTDAFFEAMSGITTTGSTVLTGLDDTSRGILLWRAILQWVGGLGFIVAGIAFLPILRVGGMQLFRAESSERGAKEMSSATRFAGATAQIYVVFTIACIAAFAAGGMTFFEAVAHALTTVATGGYSTSDSSFGYFENPFLHWTAVVFMISGSLPFAWYIRGLRKQSFRNEQVSAFLLFLLVTILILTVWRVLTAQAPLFETLRLVAFNVVSVVTTTGFATTDYTAWGPFAIAVFFALTAVGGCTGSTSGGAKMMRWIVFLRSLRVQIRMIHSPHAVTAVRYEGRVVGPDVLSGVIVFFIFYAATVSLLAFALGLYGLDLITAVSGALTAVANVGPGVGGIIGPAGNFATLPDGAKWLLFFGMYVGRLEMLTVYVLLTATFWREMA